MQCPVCHIDTQEFLVTDSVPDFLRPTLYDSCPDWARGSGVCLTCITSMEMKADPILQSLLNGSAPPEGGPYDYVLSRQECKYWTHSDGRIQEWYRMEICQRVKSLARSKGNASWVILGARSQMLQEGNVEEVG